MTLRRQVSDRTSKRGYVSSSDKGLQLRKLAAEDPGALFFDTEAPFSAVASITAGETICDRARCRHLKLFFGNREERLRVEFWCG
jgi:hypothetical protein